MAFSTQIFGPNTGISIANRKQAASMGVKAANQGRGGDKYSIQATPFTANLLKNMGGASSFNPETGEMEFLFGYSSIGDMFDGGGAGGSGASHYGGSHDDYRAANPDDDTAKRHTSSSSSSNNSSNSSNSGGNTTPAVQVSQTKPAASSAATNEKGTGWLFGFDGIGDAMDGGGAGRSGSSYSTEGSSFDPDGINNYVDPLDNKGLGGSDGMGNAGNGLTTLTNALAGNFINVADYTDGGGPGGASDRFIGPALISGTANALKGLDLSTGSVQAADVVDPALVTGAVGGEQGKQYGLEMRNGRVVYSSTGANYQGGLDVNGERQEFLDGQAVTAAQKAASMGGGDDDGGASRQTFGGYVGGQPVASSTSGGTYGPTPLFGGNYTSGSAEAAEAITAEIASLEQQIAEISASGSGQDTSMMQAELVSLQNQLASYGLSSQEVSNYISTLDPNSPDYNPEAYQAAFGFALQPNYDGGVVDPSDPAAGGGGYVRRAVKDRETGEVRYVNVPINVDSGMDQFRDERRAGFGRAIDSGMYV